jgi:D-arginine dehydrogenase
MQGSFDFAIVGGGIAGLSVASGLAPHGKVALIERESTLAYHASGRSVAMFSSHSGNPMMRALTRASRPFFEAPPPSWHDRPLLTPRGLLVIAPPEQLPALQQQGAEGGTWRELDGAGASSVMPMLDARRIARALLDPDARQIEVAALIAGYRHSLLAHGGVLIESAEVFTLEQRGTQWRLVAGDVELTTRIVINAAGAWADEVAHRAGLEPVAIQPRRRTVAVLAAPSGIATDGPMTTDAARRFYFRPASGPRDIEFLVFPCDETPVEPCDAQPAPSEIKTAREQIDGLCRPHTGLANHPVRRAWAGLRSFAPDENPVVGFDPAASGFFWLAGQGGHGIQAAPALADLAVSLILDRPQSEELVARDIDPVALSPSRFELARL